MQQKQTPEYASLPLIIAQLDVLRMPFLFYSRMPLFFCIPDMIQK